MTATLVVETVTGPRMAELRRARDAAIGDLVELRLDGVADLDVAGALEGRKRPVIVTCRPAWEGGQFDGSEDDRLRLLGDAIRLGAEYVDVEWQADRRALPHGDRTRLVLSHHDFEACPAISATASARCSAESPTSVKIAVDATRLSDCLALRDAMRGRRRHVAIAMGAAGHVTRVCPVAVRIVAGPTAASIAPGQIPARELIDRYRVRQTTAATAIYALTGAPLAHSASPAMHNAAFAALGLDAVYVPLETADAAEFRRVADAFGVAGASVTAPLKQALFGDGVTADELTGRIGAVNTLQARRRRVGGTQLRRRRVPGAARSALVAAARRPAWSCSAPAARRAAVVWALKSHGARVEIAARRPEEAVAARARAAASASRAWPPASGWDLLVNTTPVGTWPQRRRVAARSRPRCRAGSSTTWSTTRSRPRCSMGARAAGVDTIGGLEMLVGQACLQFEWWTGHDAPTACSRARRAANFWER